MTQEIKLGNTVRDLTTGYEGVAINRTSFMNGTIQYNIQPKANGGTTYPDAISIDEHLMEVIDEGLASRATPQTFESPIILGNKVKCLVTGFEGIATMKTEYLNGCAAYFVVGKVNDNHEVPELWIDQHKLKVSGKGIAEEVNKPAKAANGKTPGGPVLRGIPRG